MFEIKYRYDLAMIIWSKQSGKQHLFELPEYQQVLDLCATINLAILRNERIDDLTYDAVCRAVADLSIIEQEIYTDMIWKGSDSEGYYEFS